MQKKLACDQRK